MRSLFIPHQITQIWHNCLQYIQPLGWIADFEQFLDHVIAILVHYQLNQVLSYVVYDWVNLLFGALSQEVLEEAGLDVVFDILK